MSISAALIAVGVSTATATAVGAVVTAVVSVATVGLGIAKAVDGDVMGGLGMVAGGLALGSTAITPVKNLFNTGSALSGNSSDSGGENVLDNKIGLVQNNVKTPDQSLTPRFNSALNAKPIAEDNYDPQQLTNPTNQQALQQSITPNLSSIEQSKPNLLPAESQDTPQVYIPSQSKHSETQPTAVSQQVAQNSNVGQESNSSLLSGVGGFLKDNKEIVGLLGSGIASYSTADAQKQTAQMQIDASRDRLKDVRANTGIQSAPIVVGDRMWNPQAGMWVPIGAGA
jgi:hypothetical protein